MYACWDQVIDNEQQRPINRSRGVTLSEGIGEHKMSGWMVFNGLINFMTLKFVHKILIREQQEGWVWLRKLCVCVFHMGCGIADDSKGAGREQIVWV